jgi:LysR family transcriptional regulator, transcriptional activator of nhaA
MTKIPPSLSVEQTKDWLNYHHLYYFWRITRDGGLARAAARLRVSHSTISAQLRSLEAFLGAPLFERRGRRLVLTPLGAETAVYASDIFRLGNELVDVARGSAQAASPTFRVGVVSPLPKTLIYRLLEPALGGKQRLHLHVRQGDLTRLLPELAAHRLHLVLSDRPAAEGSSLPVYSHPLGGSEIWLYGDKKLAAQYRPDFPASLQDAPVLLPGHDSSLRATMERWFADRGLRVEVVADADDAGLLRVLGGKGLGLFPVRAGLRSEVEASSGAECVGRLDSARESYYAISVERRVRHHAVARVMEAAREELIDARKKRTR